MKIFSGLKIGERGMTNKGSLRDFKLGQKITNRGGGLKSRQKDFKSREDRFQIGPGITNRCRTSHRLKKHLHFRSI